MVKANLNELQTYYNGKLKNRRFTFDGLDVVRFSSLDKPIYDKFVSDPNVEMVTDVNEMNEAKLLESYGIRTKNLSENDIIQLDKVADKEAKWIEFKEAISEFATKHNLVIKAIKSYSSLYSDARALVNEYEAPRAIVERVAELKAYKADLESKLRQDFATVSDVETELDSILDKMKELNLANEDTTVEEATAKSVSDYVATKMKGDLVVLLGAYKYSTDNDSTLKGALDKIYSDKSELLNELKSYNTALLNFKAKLEAEEEAAAADERKRTELDETLTATYLYDNYEAIEDSVMNTKTLEELTAELTKLNKVLDDMSSDLAIAPEVLADDYPTKTEWSALKDKVDMEKAKYEAYKAKLEDAKKIKEDELAKDKATVRDEYEAWLANEEKAKLMTDKINSVLEEQDVAVLITAAKEVE